MLAIVKAIWKRWPYLHSKPFTVRIDHRNLKYLLEHQITTHAYTLWLPKLLGYDYVDEYKKGPDNQSMDSLSRIVEFQFLAITMPHVQWWKELQEEVQHDPFYKFYGQRSHHYQRDGFWFTKRKVFLNPSSSLLLSMMVACHDSSTGCYFGYHKRLSCLRGSFHWP